MSWFYTWGYRITSFLHKPMEFTNIRVDVLAMYFQVIKVEHVGLHMDCMVSRGRRVSLYIYFQHLCIVWSCMDLFIKLVVHFWDLCFVNSDCFKWSSDVFFKRHFRSFNVTLYEMPCSLHPGIPFRCHNRYFQGVTKWDFDSDFFHFDYEILDIKGSTVVSVVFANLEY